MPYKRMAQFYHVLSQNDKTAEVGQFYPDVDETPTVQYVIEQSDQQQFQTQLMLVDGQSEPIILDQSGLAYQASSYIIQDPGTSNFTADQPPQVFYKTNAPCTQQLIVEQPIAQSQPILVNDKLIQNQLTRTVTSTQLLQPATNSTIIETPILQDRIDIPKLQPRGANLIGVRPALLNHQREECKISSTEDIVSPHYKKLVITKPMQTALQEKLNSPTSTKRPRATPNRSRGRTKLQANRSIQNISSERDEIIKHCNATPRSYRNLSHSQIQPSPQQIQQQPPQLQPQPHQSSQENEIRSPQNQFLIQPPKYNKNKAPKPLPSFLHSSQIQSIIENTPLSEEFSDSIRMLVLLDNGEQRLITFTLPKEACTIQEILEQVGVPFQQDTPIQVTEADSNGLNYIVTVGHVPFEFDTQSEADSTETKFEIQHAQTENQNETIGAESPIILNKHVPPPPRESSPKDTIPARLIPGKLAVCNYCGYLSEDFNKCIRCARKLPENVKAMISPNNSVKKIDGRGIDKKLTLPKPNGMPKLNLLQRKRPTKPKFQECETVVVSSDEEDEQSPEKQRPTKTVCMKEHLEKLGSAVTISPISKEPSFRDILRSTTRVCDRVSDDQLLITALQCRTIRIGSYKFIPSEQVRIDSNGITLKVPHPKIDNIIKSITIGCNDIVKVLVNWQKSLPVLFYYIVPSAANIIRNALDMNPTSDYYFDPLSETEESHRRITLLPESISEQSRNIINRIYSKGVTIIEDLTYKEANDILIKTCPKELAQSVINLRMPEVKQLMMYPPEGRGRISINTEDYMCLGQDQFLNDVIIDFYLKYLEQNLPKQQQEKVHIFSTFFYKRLTTKPLKASRRSQPSELDPNLTPAQKRHARVKTWTKSVNLFEKDFVIIPINENSHWFLAIICFPGMNGSHTMEGQPIKIEPKQTKKKKEVADNLALISMKKKMESAIMCDDGELSDKDEAEGDDSELDSDDSEEALPPPIPSVENNSKRPAIKQPCILIFDSLAGASRSRVVATLRDYLTCEYVAKMNEEKIFNKDIIKGACPKVPQQTNFTDCGLYLLQYVEQFFKDPIKDYFIPILHLKTWFEEIIVTKKREDIALLIKSLMKEYDKDLSLIPDVSFPTLNGELVERCCEDPDDKYFDEMMEEEEEEEDEYSDKTPPHIDDDKFSETSESSSSKLSNETKGSVSNQMLNFEEQNVSGIVLKPDVSEISSKQSNKDTLSYLKAKRIVRHKVTTGDGPHNKKTKLDTSSVNS